MYHRMDKQFLASFQLRYFFVVVVVIGVGVFVWDRAIGISVFVSRIILAVFSLLSLFLQQATMISIMSWFFTALARWFGPVGVGVCGMLTHSV